MTDNEKRAHDLAVAFAPCYVQEAKEEAEKRAKQSIGTQINVDVFEIYKDLYDEFLSCLEK